MDHPYAVHWVPQEDIPEFIHGETFFALEAPNGQLIMRWQEGEHVPCWFDFLPNRDAQAPYILSKRKDGRLLRGPVPPGPLRQSVNSVLWKLEAI